MRPILPAPLMPVRLMPGLLMPALFLVAACSNNGAVSLGRMGGAPPRLILTAALQAKGSNIGTVTLTEELQGDRIVIRAAGVPEGRHPVTLHKGQCASAGASPDMLPPLEAGADGQAEVYADIPAPRLRGSADSRLAGGLAVIVSIADQRFACAQFEYSPTSGGGKSGAIDGD